MSLITITSITIPGWQGNTTGVSLRIYANSAFTAESGTIYPQTVLSNSASLGTFFQSYACTVSSGSLVIPEIEIDSTTDSPDNPSATYSAVLFDSTSGTPIQHIGSQCQFSLSPSPTSTTWAAIFATEANS